tara:strand:- start:2082 stop:3776 length:1695 start_codon:yes stop_codon:yes gene_type:complete
MSQRWWEEYPERLEFEIAELTELGLSPEINAAEKEAGKLVIHVQHTLNGQPINLTIRYPDNYPFFRFELIAPDLDLPRHQNPHEKNLCLIGRATGNWNPDQDTPARFITDQLPKVLEAANGNGEGIEETQGEPVSEYYPHSGRTVLIDSEWAIDSQQENGFIELRINADMGTARMAAARVLDASGNILTESSPAIIDLYKDVITVPWVRLPELYKTQDAKEFRGKLLSAYPHLRNTSWIKDPIEGREYSIVGVVFPEEMRYRQFQDGWIFLLTYREKTKEGKKKITNHFPFFVHAGRAGLQDMLERTPNLAFLREKKVAVVGLGSIGAPSVLEFAKNGVGELHIIDYDFVEPGTTVRWPLGLSFVVGRKFDALKHFIAQNYPYTRIFVHPMRVGAVDGNPQNDAIEEIVNHVDLVYDATAETGVHHYLAHRARSSSTPYILTSATPGAWGGVVARFNSGGPCWACFERARSEGKIPLPPEAPDGSVQPVGCGSPTFTGSSFDLQEVALTGVRLAVATLSPADKYGNVEWDIANLSLREKDKFLLPEWTPVTLEKYTDCSCAQET